MKKDYLLKALKDAMKAELDSIFLYQKAMENAEDEEIINFFRERVEEEKRHYNYLLIFHKDIEGDRNIVDLTDEIKRISDSQKEIISDDFIRRIGQKPELFSAISTAVLLEKNSFEFYKKTAENVDIEELKSFFNQMAHWETQHYIDVLHIQNEAERHYWQLNKFEPF